MNEYEAEKLDFREFSREGMLGSIDLDYPFSQEWIQCGAMKIDQRVVSCRMKTNYVDEEHDSAYVFSIPIIGLKFEFADSGYIAWEAWIAPSNKHAHQFKVPKNTESPTILRQEEELFIVKDFVPEANIELFNKLRGNKILIRQFIE